MNSTKEKEMNTNELDKTITSICVYIQERAKRATNRGTEIGFAVPKMTAALAELVNARAKL